MDTTKESYLLLEAVKSGNLDRVEQILLGKNINLEVTDNEGMTPLHHAAKRGFGLILNCLIKAGANLEAKNVEDMTPLHYTAEEYDNIRMVKSLVIAGANIEAKDKNGWTPLHCASFCNCDSILEFLLQNGANYTALTNIGKTAKNIAQEYGLIDVAELLEEYENKADIKEPAL